MVGFSVLFGIIIAGPVTGAAINPARVFGPALVGGYAFEEGMFIYYLGPCLGAILAWLTQLIVFAKCEVKNLKRFEKE